MPSDHREVGLSLPAHYVWQTSIQMVRTTVNIPLDAKLNKQLNLQIQEPQLWNAAE